MGKRKTFLLVLIIFLIPFLRDILSMDIRIFGLFTTLYKFIISMIILGIGNIIVWNTLNNSLQEQNRKLRAKHILEMFREDT